MSKKSKCCAIGYIQKEIATICTNKFDMGKSNNKLIYHHALFLFGMAINEFTMVIIMEKTEPARGPSTRNIMHYVFSSSAVGVV